MRHRTQINEYLTNRGFRYEYRYAGKTTVAALARSASETTGPEKALVSYTVLFGVARCNPKDTYDAHVGREVALRRAVKLAVEQKHLPESALRYIFAGDGGARELKAALKKAVKSGIIRPESADTIRAELREGGNG